ncbi:hypothetical protein CS022_13890 [Veronia nyctiphanis]|uniref:CN hydrolase domain-containing protein n=1 Tax=Veronia nyctiphanis TaxID=1278244 RepID=A0A4Q0YP57_9GAMM|nr:nitrilase-related carbon-nitrogen hydrolase [Veronia nyctiphanis]RXJ72722.1 hypothetical protein CS022_13890 [Veronia nyctiphanis]
MNKSALTVGLVQSQVYKGDVEKNLDTHIEHIQNAALKGADLVMFPELSLTGYELNFLATLAMDSSHPVILALSKALLSIRFSLLRARR